MREHTGHTFLAFHLSYAARSWLRTHLKQRLYPLRISVFDAVNGWPWLHLSFNGAVVIRHD
jgi:hypothetical protein